MKKRLLLAAVCILTLPIWFSPYEGDKSMGSAPFAAVAVAGHIPVAGVYCEGTPPYCGHPVEGLKMSRDYEDVFLYHDDSFAGDIASATLIIGIALMMWTRSRA